MTFTHGKDAVYERLMKEKPNWNKGSGKQSGKPRENEPFRYKYEDMKCDYCMHRKNCGFELCPEIMDNIDDLILDDNFHRAVERAGQCQTPHKTTLTALKQYFEQEGLDA
jgi:hypothetical protein